jgi:hypothetical protein
MRLITFTKKYSTGNLICDTSNNYKNNGEVVTPREDHFEDKEKGMNYYVNIGCGRTPTEGWKNYDNSPAIKLSNSPLKYSLAKSLGLLNPEQIENIEWLKKNKTEFSDATNKIPLPDKSVKVLYSSHMFEHLSRDGTIKFLNEARRVLSDDGVIRIVIPDLEKEIATYNENKNADNFMKSILVSAPPIA